ncbi:DNA cytosine methyltransferase [Rhodococcus sp. IEGM1428]|uniref:DNA cytosine methyltransferase n=1 Tax=Rhodococcus sp. IEGM1428 TaxID=3392191 RepID=UPI003D11E2E3
MRANDVSVIDFFSGCGGTSYGFEKAGLNIAAGIDFDADSATTFRQNFPRSAFIEADIRGIELDEIRELMPSGPVLFSGCAPCQPFSRQNKNQKGGDPRRSLLAEFGKVALALRPELIVVENVPGIQNPALGGPFNSFIKRLASAGYDTHFSVLRALEYGVPQERKRLVIVASRIGAAHMPVPTHVSTRRKAKTVRQTIERFPILKDGAVDPKDPDHAAMKLAEINLQRIRATPEGGDRRDWSSELIAECHRDHKGHTDAYGRMWWDRPASGLTTRCISYSNGRFGHPEQDRAISLREAASLQTFPRSFKFAGTLTSRAKQVGNAVPPLMAQRIAEALIEGT